MKKLKGDLWQISNSEKSLVLACCTCITYKALACLSQIVKFNTG